MNFKEYWNRYGELHASMCNGNVKVFASQIWDSAQGNVELNGVVECIDTPILDGMLCFKSKTDAIEYVKKHNIVKNTIIRINPYWDSAQGNELYGVVEWVNTPILDGRV